MVNVMRGIFAIVEQDGEARLVLQGFDPKNRKIVYEIALGTSIESHYLFGIKRQDSLGMARPQEVKLEKWFKRMEAK